MNPSFVIFFFPSRVGGCLGKDFDIGEPGKKRANPGKGCFLCLNGWESSGHLLPCCETRRLWYSALAFLNLPWMMYVYVKHERYHGS